MSEKTIQEKAYEVLCHFLSITDKGEEAIILEHDMGKGSATVWVARKFSVEVGAHSHVGFGDGNDDAVIDQLHSLFVEDLGLSFVPTQTETQ